jgi:hypothetical protein
MLNQSFSAENLENTYIKSTYGHKSKNDLRKFRTAIEITSNLIESRCLVDFELKKVIINKKPAYVPLNIPTEIVLTRLNENIKRIYKTKQSDRNSTIKQIIKLLEDETETRITKLDIKDFYESVSREIIINKIQNNGIVSPSTRYLLQSLFNSSQLKTAQGIPRGLGLSATLSEIYMRDFDKKIMATPGVYFYSRYVDDIVIFSYDTKIDMIEIAKKELLKLNMNLNTNKCLYKLILNCKCKISCICANNCKCTNKCKCAATDVKLINFDYLGYEIETSNLTIKRTINIKLAEKKKKKIKSRIIYSLLNYIKKGNYQLLKNRMQFLTGNYLITKPISTGKPLKGGIYYNYPLLSSLNKKTPNDITELTSFLRASINSKTGTFGVTLKSRLPNNLAKELSSISFESGYTHRRTHKFSAATINEIKRCW